jgi:hypothetical protein
MHSWDVLDAVALRPAGPISHAFIQGGSSDYRAAAKHVSCLPYGRNTNLADPLVVLHEGRGTCSTKHALLRRLAAEQGIDVALVLGIYEMCEENTPGIGPVIKRHGLVTLPEAHCYLRFRGMRVDVTRPIDAVPAAPIVRFLQEHDIAPDQIGDYKTALHQQFLREWIAESTAGAGRSAGEIWLIREECIAALSQGASAVVPSMSP